MARNHVLSEKTAQDIDKRVERVLRGLGHSEPPLRLEDVRELLRLDLNFTLRTILVLRLATAGWVRARKNQEAIDLRRSSPPEDVSQSSARQASFWECRRPAPELGKGRLEARRAHLALFCHSRMTRRCRRWSATEGAWPRSAIASGRDVRRGGVLDPSLTMAPQ